MLVLHGALAEVDCVVNSICLRTSAGIKTRRLEAIVSVAVVLHSHCVLINAEEIAHRGNETGNMHSLCDVICAHVLHEPRHNVTACRQIERNRSGLIVEIVAQG